MDSESIIDALRQELSLCQKQYNDAIFKMIVKGETPTLKDIKTVDGDNYYANQVAELSALLKSNTKCDVVNQTNPTPSPSYSEPPQPISWHQVEAILTQSRDEKLSLEKAIEELSKQKNDQLIAIEGYKSDILKHLEAIATMQRREEIQQKQIESQEQLMEQSLKQIDELSAQIALLNANTNSLASNVTDIPVELIHLLKENEDLKSRVNSLQTLLEQTRSEHEVLQQEKTEGDAIIFKLNQELEEMQEALKKQQPHSMEISDKPAISVQTIAHSPDFDMHGASMPSLVKFFSSDQPQRSTTTMYATATMSSSGATTIITPNGSIATTMTEIIVDNKNSNNNNNNGNSNDNNNNNNGGSGNSSNNNNSGNNHAIVTFSSDDNSTERLKLIEFLQQENQTLRFALDELKREKEELNYIIHDAREKSHHNHHHQTIHLASSTAATESLELQLRLLREENATLRLNIERAKLEHTKTANQQQKEVADLNASLDDANLHRQTVTNQYESLKQSAQELENTLKSKEEEHKNQLEKLRQEQQTTFQEERSRLEKSMESLQVELSECKSIINALEARCAEEVEKLRMLEEEAATSEKTVLDLTEKLKKSQQALSNSEAEKNAMIISHATTVQHLEEELHKSRMELENILRATEEQQRNLEDLRTESQSLHSTRESLTAENEELRVKLENSMKKHEDVLKEQEESLKSLFEKEIAELRTMMDEKLEQSQENSQKWLDKEQNIINQLKQLESQLEEKENSVKKEKDDREQEKSGLLEQITILKETISTLEERKELDARMITELESKSQAEIEQLSKKKEQEIFELKEAYNSCLLNIMDLEALTSVQENRNFKERDRESSVRGSIEPTTRRNQRVERII